MGPDPPIHHPPTTVRRQHCSIKSSTSGRSGSHQSSSRSTASGQSVSQKHRRINFKEGARLEARDLIDNKWWVAKVVEVDRGAGEVLLHFLGWNGRHDEWISMDSQRLRPALAKKTRRSQDGEQGAGGGKSGGAAASSPHPPPFKEFKEGEEVMALWNKIKYPAKILRFEPDGTYLLEYYDGIKKKVVPKNIRKLNSDDTPFVKSCLEDLALLKEELKNGAAAESEGSSGGRKRKAKFNVKEILNIKSNNTNAAGSSESPTPSSTSSSIGGYGKAANAAKAAADRPHPPKAAPLPKNNNVVNSHRGAATRRPAAAKKQPDGDHLRQRRAGAGSKLGGDYDGNNKVSATTKTSTSESCNDAGGGGGGLEKPPTAAAVAAVNGDGGEEVICDREKSSEPSSRADDASARQELKQQASKSSQHKQPARMLEQVSDLAAATTPNNLTAATTSNNLTAATSSSSSFSSDSYDLTAHQDSNSGVSNAGSEDAPSEKENQPTPAVSASMSLLSSGSGGSSGGVKRKADTQDVSNSASAAGRRKRKRIAIGGSNSRVRQRQLSGSKLAAVKSVAVQQQPAAEAKPLASIGAGNNKTAATVRGTGGGGAKKKLPLAHNDGKPPLAKKMKNGLLTVKKNAAVSVDASGNHGLSTMTAVRGDPALFPYLGFDFTKSKQDMEAALEEGVNYPGPARPISLFSAKLPRGWRKMAYVRTKGLLNGKWEVYVESPEGAVFRNKVDLSRHLETKAEDEAVETVSIEDFDFVLDPAIKRIRGVWREMVKSKAASAAEKPPDRNMLQVTTVQERSESTPDTCTVQSPQEASGTAEEDKLVNKFSESSCVTSTSPATSPATSSISTSKSLTASNTVQTPPASLPTTQSSALPGHQPGAGGRTSRSASAAAAAAAAVNEANKKQRSVGAGVRCCLAGCNKLFRNGTLLLQHVKHYHSHLSCILEEDLGNSPTVTDLAYLRTRVGDSKQEFESDQYLLESIKKAEEKFDKKRNYKQRTKGKRGGNSVMTAQVVNAIPSPGSALKKGECKAAAAVGKAAPAASKAVTRGEEDQMTSDLISPVNTEVSEECVSPPPVKSPASKLSPSVTPVGKSPVKRAGLTLLSPVTPLTAGEGHSFRRRRDRSRRSSIRDMIQAESEATTPTPSQPQQQPKQHSTATTTPECLLTDLSPLPSPRQRLGVGEEGGVTPAPSPSSTSPAVMQQQGSVTPPTWKRRKARSRHSTPEKLSADKGDSVSTPATETDGGVGLQTPSTGRHQHSRREPSVETMTEEELVQCACGRVDGDGLMVQCEVCLSWQHGHCAGFFNEQQVPDCYLCRTCRDPPWGRSSTCHVVPLHWGKTPGSLLPRLDGSKRRDAAAGGKNRRAAASTRADKRTAAVLKSEQRLESLTSLMGELTRLAAILHSLRVKLHVAEQANHPKVFMWSSPWESPPKCPPSDKAGAAIEWSDVMYQQLQQLGGSSQPPQGGPSVTSQHLNNGGGGGIVGGTNGDQELDTTAQQYLSLFGASKTFPPSAADQKPDVGLADMLATAEDKHQPSAATMLGSLITPDCKMEEVKTEAGVKAEAGLNNKKESGLNDVQLSNSSSCSTPIVKMESTAELSEGVPQGGVENSGGRDKELSSPRTGAEAAGGGQEDGSGSSLETRQRSRTVTFSEVDTDDPGARSSPVPGGQPSKSILRLSDSCPFPDLGVSTDNMSHNDKGSDCNKLLDTHESKSADARPGSGTLKEVGQREVPQGSVNGSSFNSDKDSACPSGVPQGSVVGGGDDHDKDTSDVGADDSAKQDTKPVGQKLDAAVSTNHSTETGGDDAKVGAYNSAPSSLEGSNNCSNKEASTKADTELDGVHKMEAAADHANNGPASDTASLADAKIAFHKTAAIADTANLDVQPVGGCSSRGHIRSSIDSETSVSTLEGSVSADFQQSTAAADFLFDFPSLNEVKQLLPGVLQDISQSMIMPGDDVEGGEVRPSPSLTPANMIPEPKLISRDECRLNLLSHLEYMQDKLDTLLDNVDKEVDRMELEVRGDTTSQTTSADVLEPAHVATVVERLARDVRSAQRACASVCRSAAAANTAATAGRSTSTS